MSTDGADVTRILLAIVVPALPYHGSPNRPVMVTSNPTTHKPSSDQQSLENVGRFHPGMITSSLGIAVSRAIPTDQPRQGYRQVLPEPPLSTTVSAIVERCVCWRALHKTRFLVIGNAIAKRPNCATR